MPSGKETAADEEKGARNMYKVCLYDAKPYDCLFFDQMAEEYGVELTYFENKLTERTAVMARGYEVVVAFVNDVLNRAVIERLEEEGVKLIAMRCSGYNNVDLEAAQGRIPVVRVPAYSPYAVAEHTMGMLLCLNRKLHRAYNRTREYNFSLNGLMGFDLRGKTMGIVGTGKIGQAFIEVCSGFGMNLLAYDVYPHADLSVEYTDYYDLCSRADIISLHCPLTRESYHLVDERAIRLMKEGVIILNTSRGALIDSEDLLEHLKTGKIGAAGLDVYEEETDLFYEDYSDTIVQDDVLARLISLPNVLVTSHQAFLTGEALKNIAETTLSNIQCFLKEGALQNQVIFTPREASGI